MNPEQTYHVAKDGQTHGPYPAEKILQYLREGRLTEADHLLDPETQNWVPLDAGLFEPEGSGATPPPPSPSPEIRVQPVMESVKKEEPSNYSMIPLTQRYGFVSIFVALGALLWLFISPVLGLPFMLVVVFLMFRGPVYFKRPKADGSLKVVGVGTKVGAVVLTLLLLVGTVATLVDVIGGASKGADSPKPEQAVVANSDASRQETTSEQPSSSAQPTQETVGRDERDMTHAKSQPVETGLTQTLQEFAQGATLETGKLPISFKQDNEYVIAGLLLVQNLDEGWLADLLPQIMFENFPKGDLAPTVFSTAISEYVRMDIYHPGTQRVIAVPTNLEAFAGVNLPENATIMAIRGRFVKFHGIELTTGETARYPVFAVTRVQLWNGEVLNFSK